MRKAGRCSEIPSGFRYIGGAASRQLHEALRDFAHLRFHDNTSLREALREAAPRLLRLIRLSTDFFKSAIRLILLACRRAQTEHQ
ncbi:hypothetical protein [Rhodoflexus caldus]|uniref:hypothetical protein n=1 Tax=Rhodoflexus caldus TaxID=2891236 RepID=UPI00202A404E|nr:hypothetical protein [Rhodoflexus caldus]